MQVTIKLRQQGIEPRSTAWKATMLTITPLSQLSLACQASSVLIFLKNRPSSHLHTAVFPSTQTNLSLVAITKLFESDLEKQKEYETHLCLSRQKDKKEIDGLRNSSQALSFYSYH